MDQDYIKKIEDAKEKEELRNLLQASLDHIKGLQNELLHTRGRLDVYDNVFSVLSGITRGNTSCLNSCESEITYRLREAIEKLTPQPTII